MKSDRLCTALSRIKVYSSSPSISGTVRYVPSTYLVFIFHLFRSIAVSSSSTLVAVFALPTPHYSLLYVVADVLVGGHVGSAPAPLGGWPYLQRACTSLRRRTVSPDESSTHSMTISVTFIPTTRNLNTQPPPLLPSVDCACCSWGDRSHTFGLAICCP